MSITGVDTVTETSVAFSEQFVHGETSWIVSRGAEELQYRHLVLLPLIQACHSMADYLEFWAFNILLTEDSSRESLRIILFSTGF